MKTDVIYVSYRNDLSWLVYSMQLLRKNLIGDFRIMVRVEEDCREIVKTWGIPATYFYTHPWPDGYTFAMYQKLISDDYSDADTLLVLDSDHMLVEPLELSHCFWEGKPILRYREWDTNPDDPTFNTAKKIWIPPTERCMGIPLDRDYMTGPPFIYWRDTFSLCRNQITKTTGTSVYDAIYSGTPYHYSKFLDHPMTFCDYESLGLYAAHFQPDKYVLQDSAAAYVGRHGAWRVYWSHGDWTPEVRAELDRLLGS